MSTGLGVEPALVGIRIGFIPCSKIDEDSFIPVHAISIGRQVSGEREKTKKKTLARPFRHQDKRSVECIPPNTPLS